MQPYSDEFAQRQLTPQEKEIVIKKNRYRADLKSGVVVEKGPKGTKKYKIEHVLGGKNVYYFLTLLKKGRLQTLPLAYDVNKKEWLDTAASGVRHIPGEQPDQPVDWKDSPYTFNTACYGCHVSQLSTNYDPEDRHLSYDLGRAGHQLRDLPRLISRAQQDREGHAQGRAPAGPDGSSAPRP